MVKKDYPVLKCFPTGVQVKAWCPFCKKWHMHGYTSDLKSYRNSHCVAHCVNKKSPFHDGGYYLKLMTKAEIRQISDSIDLYPRKGSEGQS